jgi:hypothetical protein
MMACRESLPCCVWLNHATPDPLVDVDSDSLLSFLSSDVSKDHQGDAAAHSRTFDLFHDLSSYNGAGSKQNIFSGRQYSSIQYKGDASAELVVVAFPDVAHSLLECILVFF